MKLLFGLAKSFGLNMVQLLNAKDSMHITPLHLAALHGRESSTHILLDNGSFVDDVWG